MKLRGKRLFQFLLLETIAVILVASFRFINLESTITLLMFNFLFASLIYQLNGSTSRKLSLLAVGNVVGLFWNLVFFCFSPAGTLIFGKPFDAAYTIIYPILNLMWVVPFWSLSLGVLPKMQNAPTKMDVELS